MRLSNPLIAATVLGLLQLLLSADHAFAGGCDGDSPANACQYQELGSSPGPTSEDLANFASDMSQNHASEVVLPTAPAQTWRDAVKLFVDLFTWRTPLLVLYATTEGAVSQAVKFANQHSVKVSVRSGGNSNLGWGSCNGCLVVDLSRMTNIELDEAKKQARVQPGVTNRMLVDQVSVHGIALPQGDCPMVCVGGYTVGGGLALTSRLLGLNTDAVIEFRVVDANGDVLVANANEHPDLYWGLRGGSGINLGIVVSLLFQGQTMPSQILGGHLSFDLTADATEALAGTMYDLIWGAGDPEENRPFGFSIGWVPSDDNPNGRTDLKLMGLWLSDDINRGREILDRFKSLPGYKSDSIQQGTFKDVMQPLMDQYLGFASLNWTMPDAMIAPPTSRADFSAFATTVTIAARQKPAGSMIAWVFAPLGGRVNDFASDHTAFPHRSSGGNFHMPTIWFSPTASDTVRAYGQDSLYLTKQWWIPSVNSSTSDPSSYVNHPSEYLEDYQSAYWMGNLPRLQEVKRKYDPRNFLSNGQGIIRVDGENQNSTGGLSVGSIAAIVVGCLVVGPGILAIAYLVITRRRRPSHQDQADAMLETGPAYALTSSET